MDWSNLTDEQLQIVRRAFHHATLFADRQSGAAKNAKFTEKWADTADAYDNHYGEVCQIQSVRFNQQIEEA